MKTTLENYADLQEIAANPRASQDSVNQAIRLLSAIQARSPEVVEAFRESQTKALGEKRAEARLSPEERKLLARVHGKGAAATGVEVRGNIIETPFMSKAQAAAQLAAMNKVPVGR